jgi:hypothetical protein
VYWLCHTLNWDVKAALISAISSGAPTKDAKVNTARAENVQHAQNMGYYAVLTPRAMERYLKGPQPVMPRPILDPLPIVPPKSTTGENQ